MKTNSIITIVFLLLFTNNIFAQEIIPGVTSKDLLNSAYKSSYNIKAGIGYQSFFVKQGSASFSEKMNYTPNALTYFVAFTASDRLYKNNIFINYELQVGKRTYKATPQLTDTVNLLNCTSYSYTFLNAPFQLSFRKAINKNTYWAINPGIYFDLAGYLGKIKNGSLSRGINTSANTTSSQDLKSFDIGMNTSAEIGVRAAYFGISYSTGFKNLAPDNSNMTIRNNGTLYAYVGYRFASKIGKADADKVNNLVR